MEKNRFKILSLLFLFTLTFNIGKSSWIVPRSSFSSSEGKAENKIAVCYNKDTNVYYTTIEKALEKANSGEQINVIPGTNPIITKDCTVPSGVILNITPNLASYSYTIGSTSFTIPDYSNVSNYNTTQLTVNTLKTNYTLSVFIEDNITLTNLGTIYIGGTLAAGGGSCTSITYSGHTYGDCAQLVLGKNSKLSNSGTLYLYGYLSEENENNGSALDNLSSSKIYVPFVVRDFKNGAVTVSCYNKRDDLYSFPFNQYEVRNISTIAYYRYGSTLTGMADLYASSSHNTTTMAMISSTSSSFIQLTDSNGY